MSMKAALFYGPERGLEIGTVPIPKPQRGDLLVKIAAAGLCHSDLTTLSGSVGPKDGYPIIPGHEACGTVAEVGPDVQNFKPGDKVGFLLYYHNCGKCVQCAATPIGCPEGVMQGFTGNGYFAEYAVVDSTSAMVLPESSDLVASASLFCAGLTAFHAVDQSELEAGQWGGIVGVGGLGHLAVQYALKRGAKVVALDIDDKKLKSAAELGATLTFKTNSPDYLDKLREQTGGGVPTSICFSGAGSAYDAAVNIIKPGGTLMCVGIMEGKLPLYSIPLANGALKVTGASSGWPGPMMERAINFSLEHGIMPHVSRYKLNDLPDMIDKLKKGDFDGRMVVVF